MNNLDANVTNYIDVSLALGFRNYVESLDYNKKEIWSPIFHRKFGFCYLLDLSKSEKLRYIELGPEVDQPMIYFWAKKGLDWSWVTFILQNKHDGGDAYDLHPKFYIQPDKQIEINVSYKKVNISRENSTNNLCFEMYPQTCKDIQDYELIVKKFKCHVPFLYSGPHLDELFQLKLPNCSQEVMKKAANMIKKSKPCTAGQVCNTVKYPYMEQKFNNTVSALSKAVLILQDYEVTHQHTFVNYDLQNLISEVGGVLGITLGISAVTCLNAIASKFDFLN